MLAGNRVLDWKTVTLLDGKESAGWWRCCTGDRWLSACWRCWTGGADLRWRRCTGDRWLSERRRKKKGNGQTDQHKARGAARGDQLTAKILNAGMPLPPTFSPTVKSLTFAFMIQIAIVLGLIWCTADIKAGYRY